MSEFDYDRMISVRASVIKDGEARIKELEREAACPVCLGKKEIDDEPCAECHGSGMNSVAYEHVRAINKRLEGDNARLRECLKRIAEHPHCNHDTPCPDGFDSSQSSEIYRHGLSDGHSCAAEIAREGLK